MEDRLMAKPRNPAADYAIYLTVRLFICVIQALPLAAALAFADGLAWLAYRLDHRHRKVAADNIGHAFPGLSATAIDRRVRAVFRHFCRLVIEITFLPRKMHTANWPKYVEMTDPRRFVDRLLSRRPVLLLTGHFGNWEMGGWTLGLLGFRSYAVARTLDNPHLNAFLGRFRRGTGQEIISKGGGFERMKTILAAGGIIATLADQDAGQKGLFVDFFGRPASTHKGVVLLALEHQVPMVVLGVRQNGRPLDYQIVIGDVIMPEDYEGRPDPVREMTQRFTTALEQIIRTAPGQYFWLHRRWKHEPKAKEAKQAA
jgi:KDO2-lipid IV(A) lauroyltransferase